MMEPSDLNAILDRAESLYWQYIEPHIQQAIYDILQDGGAVYKQIEETMINSATEWYGMYTPKYYMRGYTLTDSSNIDISISDVQVSPTSWSAVATERNLSPHFHWTKGFPMRNGQYRPGADILADARAMNITVDIVIPPAIKKACWQQALVEALQAFL